MNPAEDPWTLAKRLRHMSVKYVIIDAQKFVKTWPCKLDLLNRTCFKHCQANLEITLQLFHSPPFLLAPFRTSACTWLVASGKPGVGEHKIKFVLSWGYACTKRVQVWKMYLWIKSLELRSARHEFAGLEKLERLLPLPKDISHSAPGTAEVQCVQLDGMSDVSSNALFLQE